MANLSRNNHFLSQMYMDAWKMGDGKVLVYNLLVPNENYPLWQSKSLRSVGSYDSMYVRFNGDKEIDDIEKWFSFEFETPSVKALKKARNSEKLTIDEYKNLINLVACHYVRTPKLIFKILEIGRLEGKQMLNETLNELEEKHRKEGTKYYNNEKSDNCIPINITSEGDNVKFEVLIGKGFYLEMMKFLLPKIRESLGKYTWKIFNVADEIILPLSDNPVVLLNYNGIFNYDFNAKLGGPNTNIIFPLSPNKVLIGQNGMINIRENELGLGLSAFCKKEIVENAYKIVISNNEDNHVPIIRPRCVSEELFIKELKMWNDMQKGYMEEEVPFLKKKEKKR